MSLLKALDLPPPSTAGATAAPGGADPKGAALVEAGDAWRQVVADAKARIAALQKTVRAACAGEPAAFVKAAETGLASLEGALGPIDARLADALAAAGRADSAARATALAEAKTLFEACTTHLQDATLLAHIDRQPFGAKTDVKALLVEGLRGVAKAMR